MAVVAGLRRNAGSRTVYDRLIKAGKPGKVAMVACMRKLLVWLNAMVRDGLPLAARRDETAPSGQRGHRRAGRGASTARLRAPVPGAGDNAPFIRWRASLPTGRPGSARSRRPARWPVGPGLTRAPRRKP